MKGLDVLLKVGDEPVAAQQDAKLTRGTRTADISDKIELKWDDFAAGAKYWSIQCSGAYVLDDKGLKALETAFLNGEVIEVTLSNGYIGKAIITSFPIGATFNKDVTYSLVLQGKGALEEV
jgi:predicted secreted protein